jgi:hypothetical protein
MKAIIKENNFNITKLIYNRQPNVSNSILDLNKYKFLQWVECKNSNLGKIINLCKYISYLDCRNNSIDELDNLPNFINTLYCSLNKLTSLDNLPEKLSKLICSSNKITSLDNLPCGLKYLDCSNCDILNLENLPIGLKELICSVNKMSNLDYLPESIISLTIYIDYKVNNNNNFSLDLENLPKSINTIIYSKNSLPKLFVNKNIWNIDETKYGNVILEKNKNISPKTITFCPYPSNFIGSEICDECGIIDINCQCENNIDYIDDDYDFKEYY